MGSHSTNLFISRRSAGLCGPPNTLVWRTTHRCRRLRMCQSQQYPRRQSTSYNGASARIVEAITDRSGFEWKLQHLRECCSATHILWRLQVECPDGMNSPPIILSLPNTSEISIFLPQFSATGNCQCVHANPSWHMSGEPHSMQTESNMPQKQMLIGLVVTSWVFMLVQSSSLIAAEEMDEHVIPASVQDVFGEWSKELGDESITIEINERGIVVLGIMPGKGVTKMRASDIQLSKDGILFGVIRTTEWKGPDGTSSLNEGILMPFAFRCRLAKNERKLWLVDVRLYGADFRGHEAIKGRYDEIGLDSQAEAKLPSDTATTQHK